METKAHLDQQAHCLPSYLNYHNDCNRRGYNMYNSNIFLQHFDK